METPDGAAAVHKLASMVALLEGNESPRYTRLVRRAEALRATSHVAGSAGILPSEGSSSLATLAAAHASRGDHLEAGRLQQRAVDFESGQCRRLIREFKRAMERTERANEISKFPEEPLLIKREDISGGGGGGYDNRLSPPNLAGHLAILADLYMTLAEYQMASGNELEARASHRKVRTLRSAIA